MIYGNKDIDFSLKGRARAERRESTSRWTSDCGTRVDESHGGEGPVKLTDFKKLTLSSD